MPTAEDSSSSQQQCVANDKNNDENKVANLPYPALKNIFSYSSVNASRSLNTYGTVCKNWRSILQVTGSIWDHFVQRKWPTTAPKDRTFDTYLARHQKVNQTLKPIKAVDTTPIEECDFAFKCPMLLENLNLVQPAIPGGSGPVFHCDVCDKHVYTVRTQAEKDKCAKERKCVVFHKRDTHPGSTVRVRVALVTKDETDNTDDKEDKKNKKSSVAERVKKALCEIRAAADLDSCPSSISVIDRLIVQLNKKGTVAEFRHIPQSQLLDMTAKNYEIKSSVRDPLTGKAHRPFIPDVVLYMDDPDFPSNFSSEMKALSIRLGETSWSAAVQQSHHHLHHHSSSSRHPVPQAVINDQGNRTTPLGICFCLENENDNNNDDSTDATVIDKDSLKYVASKWSVEEHKNHYLTCRNGPRFAFSDFSQLLFLPDYYEHYNVKKGDPVKPNRCLEAYLAEHPEYDLKKRSPGSAGIFLRREMEIPNFYLNNNNNKKNRNNNNNNDDDEDDDTDTKSKLDQQRHPVFEVYDKNDNLLDRRNFFDIARLVFGQIREQAMNNDNSILNFFSKSSMNENDSDFSSPSAISNLLPVYLTVPVATSIISEDNFYGGGHTKRVTEILASCGFSFQHTKKESTMVVLGGGSDWASHPEETHVLQVRCGGRSSTVDVMLMEDEIVEQLSRPQVMNDFSGDILDEALLQWVLENKIASPKIRSHIRENHRPLHRLRKACMRTRQALSSLDDTALCVDSLCPDGNGDTLDLEFKLTRVKMESILEPHFKTFINNVLAALSSMKNPVSPSKIKQIALTGSVCMTPRIIFLLQNSFPNLEKIMNLKELPRSTSSSTKPTFANSPSTIAATSSLALMVKRKPYSPFGGMSKPRVLKSGYKNGIAALKAVDAAAYEEPQALLGMLDICVLTVSVGDSTTNTTVPVINRNTTFPTRKNGLLRGRQLFPTINPSTGTPSSELRVFEGERPNCDDNNLLGTIIFPEMVHPEAEVIVKFDMDANGILHVDAIDSSNDFNSVSLVITNDKGQLSPAEIDQMVREAEAFKHEDDMMKEKVTLKNEIESRAYLLKNFVDDEEKKKKGQQSKETKESFETLRKLCHHAIEYADTLNTRKLEMVSIAEIRAYSEKLDSDVTAEVQKSGLIVAPLASSSSPGGMPSGMPGGPPGLTIDSLPGPDRVVGAFSGPQIEEVD